MGRRHLTEVERLRVRVLFFDACFTKRRIAEKTGYSPHQVATAIREGARPKPRSGRPSKSGVQKTKEPETRPAEPWFWANSGPYAAPTSSDHISSIAAQASSLVDQGPAPQASSSAHEGDDPSEASSMEVDESDSEEEQAPQPTDSEGEQAPPPTDSVREQAPQPTDGEEERAPQPTDSAFHPSEDTDADVADVVSSVSDTDDPKDHPAEPIPTAAA